MYKVKRFSSIGESFSRFKSGIKESIKWSKYGIIVGGVLMLPISALVSIFGGKKGFLISEAIGSGLGLGIAAYHGYKEGSDSYDYKKKLEDPEFRKQKEDELNEYIDSILRDNHISKLTANTPNEIRSASEKYNLGLKEELYNYYSFYIDFYKKYRGQWYNAFRSLDSSYDIDSEFEYVFPTPLSTEEFMESNDHFRDLSSMNNNIMILGDFELSDHSYLFYDTETGVYEFSLGGGHNGSRLAESLTKFSSQWISPINKVSDPNKVKVARIHNDIINKFIAGIKRL